MKTAVLAILIVVLALVAAGGGFLYGTSRYTGQFSLADLTKVGTASTGAGQFAGRGQFDPSQMTPEQLQALRQNRGQSGTGQGGNSTQGGAFNQAGAGQTVGTIESIEGNVVTVKTQNSSVKVTTTDTTLIQKQMDVTVQDLTVGEQVIVSGSQAADGTTTARSIRVMQLPQGFGQGTGQGQRQGQGQGQGQGQ